MDSLLTWTELGLTLLGLLSGGYVGGYAGARARLRVETRQRIRSEHLPALGEFHPLDADGQRPALIPALGHITGLIPEADPDGNTVSAEDRLWAGAAYIVLMLMKTSEEIKVLTWPERMAFERVLKALPVETVDAMRISTLKLELGYRQVVDNEMRQLWRSGFQSWNRAEYDKARQALDRHLLWQLRPAPPLLRSLRSAKLLASIIWRGPRRSSHFNEGPTPASIKQGGLIEPG